MKGWRTRSECGWVYLDSVRNALEEANAVAEAQFPERDVVALQELIIVVQGAYRVVLGRGHKDAPQRPLDVLQFLLHGFLRSSTTGFIIYLLASKTSQRKMASTNLKQ